MARIPDEEIERLKKEVSLERLAEARGVVLTRHGADLIGLCPFHDDREPSLVITPDKNLWHCLGACQAGGSAIDWTMRAHGVSFRHAVELLKAEPLLVVAGNTKVSRVRKLEAPVDTSVDDARVLEQVVAYYHETLKASPEALQYLAKRGLHSEEAITKFRLGFANRTLGLRLPSSDRVAGAAMRGRLQALGVLRESGHEHFNGSLVIPVFSRSGEVLGMYGRKITDGLRAGTPLHMYLPGPHCGVWNEEALEGSAEIILCESLIDALTFWCAGFRNVTAAYGVNGFTPDHWAAFRKYGTRKVYLAYDRDEAGDRAAEGLGAELVAAGLSCARVLFPRGMDANEYALKVAPAAKGLQVLLNRAEWMGGAAVAAKEEVASVSSLAAVVVGDEVVVSVEDRRYRVRGLEKNTSVELLKVNVLASREEGFHVDTLDLYSARPRAAFIKLAAVEMGVKEEVVKRDLGRVLLKLEEIQEERRGKALEPKPIASMSEEERAAALALLRDPRLMDRILEDFAACGVVGEETNKLVGYVAAVSRHLEAPLAVLIQSSSAAGKSSLMDSILAFVPEEQRVEYSAMTGQSLFYMGETDLKNKVLAIAEEEGVSRAAYALKLLQSEGALTMASTGKDGATGRLVTRQYRVEGPVMIFLTTTAIHLDEELLNRCLVLTVDEDREQTRAIHRLQRERQTIDGVLLRRRRDELVKLHRNAQRLLRPLFVVNPFALSLTFLDARTRTRRDHMKYLTLIRAVALLHQHQRPVLEAHGVSYIEVSVSDIAVANRLAHEVLGRSLDELPPQTRRLLLLLDEMAPVVERADFRFSRKEVRLFTGWGDTQLRVHLRRLEELEFIVAHRGGRGQSFVYELVFVRGEMDSAPVLAGLVDVAEFAGGSRGVRGGVAGEARDAFGPMNIGLRNGFEAVGAESLFPGGK